MPYARLSTTRSLLLRGFVLSTFARIAVAIAVTADPWDAARRNLSPVTTVAFAALCGFLMFVDATRRRDLVLFANLGVSAAVVVLCAVVPALAIEATIALFGALCAC